MIDPSPQISDLIARIYSLLPSEGCSRSPLTFRYVGRATGPRWIFPAGEKVGSVLASWSPYKFFSRMAWRAVRCATAERLTTLLPGVGSLTVDNLPLVDWSHIGWKRQTDPIPVIYIGTPGPRQKAVIHLVNSVSGMCEAVLKAPLRLGARESIVHESDVLAVMEDELLASAPSLLFSDRQRALATQRFLPGTSGSRRFLPEYQNLLRSLILRDEHTTLAGQATSWHDHPLWDSLNQSQLETLAMALAEQSQMTLLPACWMHGDFAPWNIRQSKGTPPMLIDWEMGQRAALPLQDAFHFLHMQQFLFHRRPGSFVPAVERMAKSMGIPPALSRKLELAYLARTYFSCAAWDETKRAEFIFKSLLVSMREGRRSTVSAPPSRLRLVASRPERQLESRSEMLSAVTTELERGDVPYCILSGYEKAAALSGSDVDIMFRPEQLRRVPAALARAARAVGASVVQAIQHETSACYFVLARPEGKHVTHLAIDAYGDYRRDGRAWLSAAPLIARRRRYRDFFRLSIADEFVYRLTKKVLKQSLPMEQMKRLLHLFARDSGECQDRLAQHWSPPVAYQIERALLRQDRQWMAENLSSLRQDLLKSRPVEKMLSRCKSAVLEKVRLLSRIARPTGFFLTITGDSDVGSELADRLMCNLGPAFRRTEVLQPAENLWRGMLTGLRIYVARIRSTLVIETADDRSRRRWGRPPDLELRLLSGAQSGTDNSKFSPSGRVVTLGTDEYTDELVKRSTAVILHRLASRTGRRMSMPRVCIEQTALMQSHGETAVELEFVGSD